MIEHRKKAIIVLILVSSGMCLFAATDTAESGDSEPLDCMESMLQGEMDVSVSHNSNPWFWGGFVPTVLLSPLIGLISIGITALESEPTPRGFPDKNEVNVKCYLDGYGKEARKMNIRRSATGVLVGFSINLTVILLLVAIAG